MKRTQASFFALTALLLAVVHTTANADWRTGPLKCPCAFIDTDFIDSTCKVYGGCSCSTYENDNRLGNIQVKNPAFDSKRSGFLANTVRGSNQGEFNPSCLVMINGTTLESHRSLTVREYAACSAAVLVTEACRQK